MDGVGPQDRGWGQQARGRLVNGIESWEEKDDGREDGASVPPSIVLAIKTEETEEVHEAE